VEIYHNSGLESNFCGGHHKISGGEWEHFGWIMGKFRVEKRFLG